MVAALRGEDRRSFLNVGLLLKQGPLSPKVGFVNLCAAAFLYLSKCDSEIRESLVPPPFWGRAWHTLYGQLPC